MIYCLLKLVNYLVFVDTNGHICDYQVSADLQKFVPGLPFLTPYKHQTHGQRQAHILKTSETNVTHMCPLLKDSNFSADFHRAGGGGGGESSMDTFSKTPEQCWLTGMTACGFQFRLPNSYELIFQIHRGSLVLGKKIYCFSMLG